MHERGYIGLESRIFERGVNLTVTDCHRGGVKIGKKSVTYFVNGP